MHYSSLEHLIQPLSIAILSDCNNSLNGVIKHRSLLDICVWCWFCVSKFVLWPPDTTSLHLFPRNKLKNNKIRKNMFALHEICAIQVRHAYYQFVKRTILLQGNYWIKQNVIMEKNVEFYYNQIMRCILQ